MEYFNVIIQIKDKDKSIKFLKYRHVNKIDSLITYLEKKGFEVLYINLYNEKTKIKLDSYPHKSI